MASPHGRDRSAVHGHFQDPTPSAALTVDDAVRSLLDAGWPERWEMLRGDGRLAQQSVAEGLADRDSLLGLVVARAARVGVDAVAGEFPLVFEVARIAGGAECDADDAVRTVGRAAEGGLGWAFPVISAAIARLAPMVEGGARSDLMGIALAVFAGADGLGPDLVSAAWRLTTTNWDEVWAELPKLADLAGLGRAAAVVRYCRALFDADDPAITWAGDLAGLADAAGARGAEAAVEEHRLILTVRRLIGDAGGMAFEERLRALSGLAGRMGGAFQDAGASWVLPAAIDAARKAESLAGPSHPDYAEIASNLGALIAEAVQAGVADKSGLGEALAWQRRAVQATDPAHPDYPGYASNLGALISEAVQAGLAGKSELGEALAWQRRAVQATDPAHPDYPAYASNLGNRIYEAVQAGVADKSELGEALAWQRLAVEATDPAHPDYPRYASNLATRISQAVQAGVADRSELGDALGWQRLAVQATDPAHPRFPMYASNLGSLISEAVQAGVMNASEAASELVAIVSELWQAVRGNAATPRQRIVHAEATRVLADLAPEIVID
ncbi:MAG: hypothetical protein LBT54_06090, partial [Bifidobacteriaceae bacterium]|nr:hypothetical protein [Bifidobacteriaceae bacterium]